MMNVLFRIVLPFLLAGAQDGTGLTVSPTLELSADEFNRSVFSVHGTTNLPDGAELEVTLYAIGKEVEKGERESKWIDSKSAKVAGGRFAVEIVKFQRKPFPVKYEASVVMIRKDQDDAVRRLIDAEEIATTCAHGEYDEAGMKEEVKVIRKELHEDFTAVNALYREFKETFAACLSRKENGFKEWTSWTKNVIPRIDAVVTRNDRRIGFWIVKIESRGKLYIGGMCQRIRDLLERGEKTISGTQDTAPIHEMMAEFEIVYGEYFTQMDFIDQIDRSTLLPPIESIEKTSVALGTIVARAGNGLSADEWTKAKEEIGGKMTQAVFELSALLPESMTDRIAAIAESYAGLVAIGDRMMAGEKGLAQSAEAQMATLKGVVASVMKTLEKARE